MVGDGAERRFGVRLRLGQECVPNGKVYATGKLCCAMRRNAPRCIAEHDVISRGTALYGWPDLCFLSADRDGDHDIARLQSRSADSAQLARERADEPQMEEPSRGDVKPACARAGSGVASFTGTRQAEIGAAHNIGICFGFAAVLEYRPEAGIGAQRIKDRRR